MLKGILQKVLWGVLSAAVVIGCVSSAPAPVATVESTEAVRAPATAASIRNGDKLRFKTLIDLSSGKGQTFLSFMKSTIKPALDGYADNGFTVAGGDAVSRTLKNVGDGVSSGALKNGGSEQNLVKMADKLSQAGPVTVYTLPNAIKATKLQGDMYRLSPFFALASGGGVAVYVSDNNYYYNVNYGTGKNDKDEMTGRSYGAGPTRDADDVSDKDYLKELQDYVRTPNQDISQFYRTMLEILLNCDPVGYAKISPQGQTVMTDFLAVYTAEEDRHMMDPEMDSHAWDVALMEVTLLSALHGGQDKVMVMFNGTYTDTTPVQAPAGQPRTRKQPASMTDWWQFTTNLKNPNRSGINITLKDFRYLGAIISEYERKINPGVLAKVEAHFNGTHATMNGNVFQALSSFIVNPKAPDALKGEAYSLAKDVTAFLMQVNKDANQINDAILKAQDRMNKKTSQ